jgi:hypothetical protein
LLIYVWRIFCFRVVVTIKVYGPKVKKGKKPKLGELPKQVGR